MIPALLPTKVPLKSQEPGRKKENKFDIIIIAETFEKKKATKR